MDVNEIIGTLAGIFTTVAVVPQIVKAVRTQKVADVSPIMYLVLCTGVALWTTYGILKMDWPIIITNGISVILNFIMLYIILTQDKK